MKTGAEAKVWKGGETKVGSFGRTDRQGEREEKDNLTGGADLFEAVCARNKWQYNTEEKGGAALMEKLHPFFPGPSHPPILSFYFFVPESCLHCLSMLYSYASAATKFRVAYACQRKCQRGAEKRQTQTNEKILLKIDFPRSIAKVSDRAEAIEGFFKKKIGQDK